MVVGRGWEGGLHRIGLFICMARLVAGISIYG